MKAIVSVVLITFRFLKSMWMLTFYWHYQNIILNGHLCGIVKCKSFKKFKSNINIEIFVPVFNFVIRRISLRSHFKICIRMCYFLLNILLCFSSCDQSLIIAEVLLIKVNFWTKQPVKPLRNKQHNTCRTYVDFVMANNTSRAVFTRCV